MIYKCVGLLIILSILSSSVFSDDIVPPEPPRTASLEKLISSILELKQEVNSLRQDNKELKIQLTHKLDDQHNDLLFFCAFFVVGSFFFFNILKRIYLFLMFKRLQRRNLKLHEEILGRQDYILNNTSALDILVSKLSDSFLRFQTNLSVIAPHIVPVKKKSFWSKLMFWRRKNG